ncbi:hypothetical protein PROVALCAL_04078 [Providencia alcalifaciens DSM 30120]|uniref:Uncharacterized protein n=1 Tax=Providencia alcalifaciens DSM 30120 TaxID=520999 RepID=B6XL16_9GAMM|nr:hypothetical protein [Providencia alcalifaciens]EEB43912.1 hypothetical protein PROVALCAL_04078 [Providencia alcalifaciens DSM 30120]
MSCQNGKNFFRRLWDNHGQINNVFTGLHYLFLSIAILVGGVWVLYSFSALHSASNAEAQLEKTKEELKQIQQQIKDNNSSSISIETTPLKSNMGIIINVTVKNNGKSPVSFDTSKTTVSVYKVEIDGENIKQTAKFEPRVYTTIDKSFKSNETKILPKVHVLIGAEKTLSYVVGIDSPGLYYITFRSVADKNFDKTGIDTEKSLEWFASTYVEIE